MYRSRFGSMSKSTSIEQKKSGDGENPRPIEDGVAHGEEPYARPTPHPLSLSHLMGEGNGNGGGWFPG
jgi:hypothetical protein